MNVTDTTVTLASGVSASADFTSISYAIGGATCFCIHVAFLTGTMAGTFTAEGSNDLTLGFVTVPSSSTAVTASAGFLYSPTVPAGYKYVRFKWTYTSGTGTMTGVLVVKGISG